MRAKILNTTNEKVKKYIGEIRNCFRLGNTFCLEDSNKHGYGIKTSSIVSEERNNDILIIKTKNSVYELEIVEE